MRDPRSVAILASLLCALVWPAFVQASDNDGVPDLIDNCVDVDNPGQENDDLDRFGNACDGDLNNDGVADASDDFLLSLELQNPEPIGLVDFDGNGVVDSFDADYFDTHLLGQPSGPAGANAHDGDGDGILDFCSPAPVPAFFASEWDPSQHPDLLVNGALASTGGAAPDDWDPTTPNFVAYRTDMAETGVYQVLPFGGFGGITPGSCYGACVAPTPIPVTFGTTYAFSFLSCAGSFPPAAMWVIFDEFDAQGGATTAAPLGGDKAMSSVPGVWEETIVFYTPSSDQVVTARPKLGRKSDPANGNTTYFSTDFAFWELDATGNRTYRHPPATKQAFDGARTRVDALGNISVLNLTTQQFESFFPIGISGSWQRGDFSFYTDMGFNVFMNDRGVNSEAPLAVAAGMRFMTSVGGLWNPSSYPNASQMLNALALNALDPEGVSVPVYDYLLGFYTDNENFSQCLQSDGSCIVPYTSPWNGSVEPQPGISPLGPMPDLYAFDRAQNGGSRGVPSHFLNGNPNVARAYAHDVVNAEGDVRMDVTGAYGVSGFEQVVHAMNQTGPGVYIQIQAHQANTYIPTAWAGVARGARGISTWRDETNPYFLRAPTMRICGTSLPTFTPRLTLENPPGSLVEGEASGAQAEILVDKGDDNGCRKYFVKLQPNGGAENFFQPGATEILVDPTTGAPFSDAYVDAVTGSYEVIHVGSLDQYAWTTELSEFRDDIEFLSFMLEGDPKTEWSASCAATLANVAGNPGVQFGDQGIVCGTRTFGEALYLIVSNTYSQIDPFADYLQQHVGEALDVEVALSNLPAPSYKVRFFDSATNSFSIASQLKDDALSFTLPPFGVAVVELKRPGQ